MRDDPGRRAPRQLQLSDWRRSPFPAGPRRSGGASPDTLYLATFGILVDDFDFSPAVGNYRAVRAIRTSSQGNVSVIGHLIEWPDNPSHDWLCGFLAGIFDAEGSYSKGVWRVPNTDPEIIKWTCLGLDALSFDYVLEPLKRPNDMVVVRLRGGLKEAMRFFHATAPTITRKRSIEGAAVKSGAKLRVTAIEPLGLEMPMYDITTGTGDFIANGVVSHNCFARNTHTYLDLDPGRTSTPSDREGQRAGVARGRS